MNSFYRLRMTLNTAPGRLFVATRDIGIRTGPCTSARNRRWGGSAQPGAASAITHVREPLVRFDAQHHHRGNGEKHQRSGARWCTSEGHRAIVMQ